jgi:hypothetical protein
MASSTEFSKDQEEASPVEASNPETETSDDGNLDRRVLANTGVAVSRQSNPKMTVES